MVDVTKSLIDIEKMLIVDEGEKFIVYPCTKGKKTVGVGHNLDANPALYILGRKLKYGDKITKKESRDLLKHDIAECLEGIDKKMPFFNSLEEKYKIVLINMVFNIGIYGVLEFKNTIAAMKRNDVASVVKGLKNSKYYKQVGNRSARMVDIVEGKIPEEYI
jgi:lysozyme